MTFDCETLKPGDVCEGGSAHWAYVSAAPASNGALWHVFISGNTLHLVDRSGHPVVPGERDERILGRRAGPNDG